MKRIMIIEDDAVIRSELRTLLRANGYAAVEEGPCDLVLMDVNLPGLSAHTAMQTALMIGLTISAIYVLYFIITCRIACGHVICHGSDTESR